MPKGFHWTTKRPGRHPESGFLAFAAEYHLHGYIVAQIKKGSAIFEVEKRHSLLYYATLEFEVFQVFAQSPPDLDGVSVPHLDLIRMVLEAGADPNEAIQGTGKRIWEAVLIHAAEIPKHRSLSEKLIGRPLSHWIPIVGEFIRHKADPRMNRNAASGSYVRDAFGVFFPKQARALEKELRALQSRLSNSGVFFVPLAAPGPPPSLDDVTPLPILNRLRSVETQGVSFREYLEHHREKPVKSKDNSSSFMTPRPYPYPDHGSLRGLRLDDAYIPNGGQSSLGYWEKPIHPSYSGDDLNRNLDPLSFDESDSEGAQSCIHPDYYVPHEPKGDDFDDDPFPSSQSQTRPGKSRAGKERRCRRR